MGPALHCERRTEDPTAPFGADGFMDIYPGLKPPAESCHPFGIKSGGPRSVGCYWCRLDSVRSRNASDPWLKRRFWYSWESSLTPGHESSGAYG